MISTEARGNVWLIGLDRASKRNAFNLEMLASLAKAMTAYEEDPALRCAVLFAHGDHFTGGLDLGDVGPAVGGGETLWPAGEVDPLGLTGRKRTKPLICAVQGWCLTIGVELLLASDIRLAATGTRFAQMEVKRGIMAFGGATLRFPQIAGWGGAMRYLLTGDEFDAGEAYRLGLVQEVVAPEALFERALGLGEAVARQAPLAVQATLSASRLAIEEGHGAAVEALLPTTRRLMATEDAQEGVRSFLERREGQYQGR